LYFNEKGEGKVYISYYPDPATLLKYALSLPYDMALTLVTRVLNNVSFLKLIFNNVKDGMIIHGESIPECILDNLRANIDLGHLEVQINSKASLNRVAQLNAALLRDIALYCFKIEWNVAHVTNEDVLSSIVLSIYYTLLMLPDDVEIIPYYPYSVYGKNGFSQCDDVIDLGKYTHIIDTELTGYMRINSVHVAYCKKEKFAARDIQSRAHGIIALIPFFQAINSLMQDIVIKHNDLDFPSLFEKFTSYLAFQFSPQVVARVINFHSNSPKELVLLMLFGECMFCATSFPKLQSLNDGCNIIPFKQKRGIEYPTLNVIFPSHNSDEECVYHHALDILNSSAIITQPQLKEFFSFNPDPTVYATLVYTVDSPVIRHKNYFIAFCRHGSMNLPINGFRDAPTESMNVPGDILFLVDVLATLIRRLFYDNMYGRIHYEYEFDEFYSFKSIEDKWALNEYGGLTFRVAQLLVGYKVLHFMKGLPLSIEQDLINRNDIHGHICNNIIDYSVEIAEAFPLVCFSEMEELVSSSVDHPMVSGCE
jgi:hypothetical protein